MPALRKPTYLGVKGHRELPSGGHETCHRS
jgi:hypothetical protein